jgi:hypothetical protein
MNSMRFHKNGKATGSVSLHPNVFRILELLLRSIQLYKHVKHMRLISPVKVYGEIKKTPVMKQLC